MQWNLGDSLSVLELSKDLEEETGPAIVPP